MRVKFALAVLNFGLLTAGAFGATIGQVDTFSSGVANWEVGDPTNPNQPLWVAGGGPGGASDGYLQLRSGPNPGPGSRLAVNNDMQWAGNYLASGIGAIAMDVRNLGTTDLYLRLLVETENPNPGPPLNAAFSTNAVFVPAGSGWTRVLFPLAPSALTSTGLGTITGALSNVSELRLFHNPNPSFAGPPNSTPAITALLGIDNISAVPEPSTLVLSGLGAACLFVFGRRRRAANPR